MRLLVVEDDHKVAAFIERGLQQEGYAVDVLFDGRDAGLQAQLVDYDAIILDVMLPGRSGVQVLRDIRARKPAIPSSSSPRATRSKIASPASTPAPTTTWQAVRARRALGAAARAAPPRRAP
jgi:DNA-binding response OmpR family regulator